jgi:predicted DNA-binding protein YlxM (UPF0122 family)
VGVNGLKDLQTIALLIDFYGDLLTTRQQEWVRAYYLEDLSLAEIAGEGGVSRQAVHDLIKRAEASLVDYEAKLGFVREYTERQERLISLEEALLRSDQKTCLAILAALKGS